MRARGLVEYFRPATSGQPNSILRGDIDYFFFFFFSFPFFFNLTTGMRVFSQIDDYQQKKNCGAPILGLAKSII